MEIIKEIFSNKKYKAEIIKRKDNLYQVYTYLWDAEWETWLQVTEGLSITDTEQSAINSAVEHLCNYAGENIEF
jgi:threonyl-tRNA synthetase